MRRNSAVPTLLVLLVSAALTSGTRQSAAADTEPLPAVTPFIDSGNDLPDLTAPGRQPASPPAAARGAWYGWQILAGDLAVLTCAASSRSGVCLVPYFLGPAIHLAHDRGSLAWASVGLRLLGPATGAAIGASLANCPDRSPAPQPQPQTTEGHAGSGSPFGLTGGLFEGDFAFCGLEQAAVGAVVGATLAAIVDASIGFARAEPNSRLAAPPRTIEPELSVGPNRVSFGLAGSF